MLKEAKHKFYIMIVLLVLVLTPFSALTAHNATGQSGGISIVTGSSLSTNALSYSNSSNYAFTSMVSGGPSIPVIDTVTNSIAGHIAVGGSPYSVAVTPNGTLLLTVSDQGSNLTVTNLKTFTNIANIPTPATPDANMVSINPDGLYAYVAGYDDYNISVVSLTTFSTVTVIHGTYDPYYVALSPNGTLGFAVSINNIITVFNAITNTYMLNSTNSYLSSPSWATVSPDGSLLAIANAGSDNVTIMNASTFAPIKNILVPGNVMSVAFSSSGSRLYSFDSGFSDLNISVINTRSLSVMSNMTIHMSSTGGGSIALAHNGSYLYVASYDHSNVTVVNLKTLSQTGSISLSPLVGYPNQIVIPSSSYYKKVAFHETGLPAGSVWSVNMYGHSWSSSKPYINATAFYGQSSYTTKAASSIFYNNSVGTLTVSYSSGVQNVHFNTLYNYSDIGYYSFLPNYVSGNNVTVFSLINGTSLGNLSVGLAPLSVAITPNLEYLLAYNSGSQNITVIDLRTLATVTSIALPYSAGSYNQSYISINPDGLYAYVGGVNSSSVVVVSLTTFSVVKVLTVGAGPLNIAISPNGTRGFVVNYLSGNISILDTINNTVIGNITTGSGSDPWFDAVSPNGKILAVATHDNVTLIDTGNYSDITNISMPANPNYLAFNGTGNFLYVVSGSGTSSYVSSINMTNYVSFNQSYAFIGPYYVPTSIAMFPSTNFGLISFLSYGSGPGVVGVISLTSLTLGAGVGGLAREISQIVVPSTTYYSTVSFHETGLYSGTTWDVVFGGRTFTSNTSYINATGYIGDYNLSVTAGNKYFVSAPVNFTIAPASTRTVPVTFSPILFKLTVNETGLPSGYQWSLSVNGTVTTQTTTSASIMLLNGTYHYVATSLNNIYHSVSGTFTVSGKNISFNITFVAVKYTVSVKDVGLPVGTSWYLNSTGIEVATALNSMSFKVTNGTYDYTIQTADKTYTASGGSFTVLGSSISLTVTFTRVVFTFKVTETGLPSGTSWTLFLSNGHSVAGTAASHSISLPNGTYSYQASSVAPYNTVNGNLKISGSSVTKAVSFHKVTYAVTFTETGLATNATWYVNLTNGQSYKSNTSTVSIQLSNGTYSYGIQSSKSTYSAPGGSVTVNGKDQSVSVTFSAVLYKVKFTESGLPTGSVWSLTVNGQTYNTSTTSITVQLTNGSYTISISAPHGYRTNTSSVSVGVNGNSLVKEVAFTKSPNYTIFIVIGGVVGAVVVAGVLLYYLNLKKKK